MPSSAWQVGLDADGDLREHADVAELTGLLDLALLAAWQARMRVIVRGEHPHPGAPLNLFEHHDAWRYQVKGDHDTGHKLRTGSSAAPADDPACRAGQATSNTRCDDGHANPLYVDVSLPLCAPLMSLSVDA
jgi:hypothetical protein